MKKFLLTLAISLLSVFSFAGKVVEIEKYDNGNTKTELIAHPGVDGDTYEYNEYYVDGSVKLNGEYNEYGRKSGGWYSYYDNGQLESYAFFSNGTYHGNWWWYDRDGSVLAKVTYKHGKKHGDWAQYTHDGQLICERHFKRGKAHGVWKVYEGDMLVVQEEYKNGKLVDGWEWHEEKGLIARYP